MPSLSSLLAGSILGSLVLYALLGGADFGGGVWDLFARGPRADAQRQLIARAIGPVWETNHIWLIVAIVILFTGFPSAFAAISTALFVPLTLLLAGIVLRGAAFAFHAYHLHEERGTGRWGTLFAGASLVTPVLLGVTIGALSSGRIPAEPLTFTGDTASWLAPYPLSVGVLTLSAFSYLAAVYLIMETDDPDLRSDFRCRALWSAAAVALLSVFVPVIAASGAPDFYGALTGSDWFVSVAMFYATAALGACVSLVLSAYSIARIFAAAQVVLILLGWGLAQFPFLARPAITFSSSASSPSTLRLLLLFLAAGAVLLFPAIFLLMRIFKREALSGRYRETP
ncbi:MAG TPA: cytochrome d ubiquinol oxidase subunit II [Candidatus Limnocylindria bacterium]|nr:cytochrome d ubiquinol oxidase subunit II [Candidatus Limnocylindria bacterium]